MLERGLVLEQADPLFRAYKLVAHHIPPEQWPDAELNAYCDAHCQHLKDLTDAELEALINAQNL